MIELDRNGITIDRCDRCRGIWLDRGELEKMIARAGRDDEEETLERERPRVSDDRHLRDDRYERDDYRRRDHDDSDVFHRRRKKKSSFLDIFDFD
jgi:hypothetical protein